MNRWLAYCVRRARRRDSLQRFRLHAVLVRGGRVQAEGFNFHPTDMHARVVNPKAPTWMGMHAEVACLRSATPEQIRGSTLYVGGVNYTGKLIRTRPCEWCLDIIADAGVQNIAWHDAYGRTHRVKTWELL